MEGNIPYRRLKSLKHHGVSSTSQRLLAPIFRYRSSEKPEKTIMSRNVTDYQHMLADSHIKQNYIKWAIGLRSNDFIKKKSKPSNNQNQVPSVFYKHTQSQKFRQAKTQSQHLNTAQYSQFFGKQSTNLPQKDLSFLSQLRTIQLKDQNKGQTLHDAKFINYGGKEKGTLPRILKKSAIKKLRDIRLTDYEDSYDGTHQYPEYTYKNLRQKNSNLIQSLTKNYSAVSLPGIAWSVGLRSY